MALDFSRYLDVPVDTLEAPKPPPIGHYFATIKSWKGAERDYDKATGGPKTPVVEVFFSLTSPDEDVEEDLLPKGGVSGKLVSRDYTLNEESGTYQLRFLAEETCGLPTKGLSLGDTLAMLPGQEVRVQIGHRAGQDEGQFFPKVLKVISAS